MNCPELMCRLILAIGCGHFAVLPLVLHASTPQFSLPLGINPDQSITYYPYPNGDRIPDFSTVGFQYGNTPVPGEPGGYDVPVLVTLQPGTGDQTDRIQAAIDFIATRPLVNGFRGAVLLKAGRWEIHSVNRIRVTASGVVIRGEGDHPLTGTRLYAVGTTNENQSGNTRNSRLIAFDGGGITAGTTRTLVDNVYIPGGTNVIPISGHPFTVGQRVQVRWPGSIAWQKASYYNTAATVDKDPAITFNRIVTAVTPNSITLDAPITSPLDPAWGRGYVVPVTAFSYITNVGVSDIYFESTYASDTDENHVWNALDFTEVEDGFVNGCTARHFAYSIAYVNTSTRKITINRSQCHDGISILQGGRRYSFVLTGEMGLVSNNIGRNGRHTFIINWPAAPGPNVFVDGVSSRSFNESGSHAEWNNGGLWDNISELSATVGLQVKLERPSAFCVAWNVVTNTLTFENMPLSPNWSFGTTAVNGGPAAWRNSGGVPAGLLGKAEAWYNGTRMPVRSLYANQLETRLRAARNPHTHQANLPVRINLPPTIRTPAQLVVLSGAAWSYQLPVSNVVAAITTPNYSATGLPAGLSINATTGLISGTLPTVTTETSYNLTLSARNQDGTTTKPMTLTVRPAGAPKIPLTMALEVDMQRTTPLLISGVRSEVTSPIPVPMVPASRLLAPMIVRKSYTSDINGTAYTLADIPVPVRGVLPIEGLTSSITITYNGSTTLPTLPGYYDIVATLDDPIYEASTTGRLLITTGTAVTVTLANTSAPTASAPVTATSTQSSITPVITYDGSPTFPASPGQYTAKAIVANADFFGTRAALISVQRPAATLTIGNSSLPYTGAVGSPVVTTNPPGLATRVSIVGQGVFPGTYPITAWINDPNYSHTPVAGNMTITGLVISTPDNLTISGSPSGALVNFEVSAGDGFTATTTAYANPPSGSLFPVGSTTVNVTANNGSTTANASFTVTVFPGPGNLQQINPSAGVAPGTVEILAADSIRIVGAGGATSGGVTADLWTGTNDSNTYLSMPWQGDGVFTARLVSFSSTDASAKAGIIFRETTSAGSRYSTIHMLRSGSVNFQHKTATNGSATGTNFFSGSASSTSGFPEWLRMTRQGGTFTLAFSDNGTTWTTLSTQANTMNGSTLSVGFVVAPRTGNTTATAVFDNIRFFSPLQSWRQQYFGASVATGAGADNADPDRDGADNLVEYATGNHPTQGGVVLSSSLGVSADRLRALFSIISDPSLVYRIEATDNLVSGPWQTVSEFRGGEIPAGPVEVQDFLTVSEAARRFMRLIVTHSPLAN
ncbi:MAG: MBG domain-containing protein [Candidatus Methylacidiphilales bacterium]|nr:MBG domain-containing protein [Candidatus Methylacidiphilales bacterium]